MPCHFYWSFYASHNFLVSDWRYYEVKLVFIIRREDGNKTSTEDAREVADQWVSNNKTHIEFLLLLVQDKMSIIFVYYSLQVDTSNQRLTIEGDKHIFEQSPCATFRRVRYCIICLNTV